MSSFTSTAPAARSLGCWRRRGRLRPRLPSCCHSAPPLCCCCLTLVRVCAVLRMASVTARIEAIVAPALQPSRASERISTRQQAPPSPANHGNMQPAANQQLAAAGRLASNGAASYAALPFPPGSLPVLLQLALQQQQQVFAQQHLAAIHAESHRGMMQALLAPQQVQGAGTAPAHGPPAPIGCQYPMQHCVLPLMLQPSNL